MATAFDRWCVRTWLPAGLAALAVGCGSGTTGPAVEETPVDSAEVFLETKADLAAQGIVIDRKLWEDPDLFRRYIQTFVAVAERQDGQAVETASMAGQLGPRKLDLVGDRDVGLVRENYCGPGSGSALPNVTDCMNRACQEHDGCYERCTGSRGSKLCSFTSATSSCDHQFFAAIDACQGQRQEGTQQQLLSDAVTLAAQLITRVPHNDACGADFTCPR